MISLKRVNIFLFYFHNRIPRLNSFSSQASFIKAIGYSLFSTFSKILIYDLEELLMMPILLEISCSLLREKDSSHTFSSSLGTGQKRDKT
ncbi:MAG: hypothetical protein AAGF93_22245, partial [Cyanobacteria bacterium P01_H01_bin.105]